jgi:hypothetical protein
MARDRFVVLSLTAIAVAFVLFRALGAQSTSGVIYACSGQGHLRVVAANESCKNNETAVQWNIVGPAGPQGDEGPRGLPGLPGTPGANGTRFVIVDSVGQIVGPMVGCCGPSTLLKSASGLWVSYAPSNGPFATGYTQVFTQANCQGAAYITIGPGSHPALQQPLNRPGFAVQHASDTPRLYFPDGTPQVISMASQMNTGTGICQTIGAFQITAASVGSIDLSHIVFPVAIEEQ